MQRPRLIVGISGATGVVYGIRLLQAARALDVETHLVVTKAGERTLAYETDLTIQGLRKMADHTYPDADIGAAIASGSFLTLGMVVAPCSVHSLAEIAHSTTDGLLTRAADVCLKERRQLVLLFRETPLHAGHIRSMAAATENGAIIFPPVPAFYTRPELGRRDRRPYGGPGIGSVWTGCGLGQTLVRTTGNPAIARSIVGPKRRLPKCLWHSSASNGMTLDQLKQTLGSTCPWPKRRDGGYGWKARDVLRFQPEDLRIFVGVGIFDRFRRAPCIKACIAAEDGPDAGDGRIAARLTSLRTGNGGRSWARKLPWRGSLLESLDQWKQFAMPSIGLFGRVEDFAIVAATVRRLRRGGVDNHLVRHAVRFAGGIEQILR